LPPLKGISLTADLTDVTGVDLVLPPADNILQNSHFENDLLPTQWMADGIVPPTRTLRAHTGDYALVLARYLIPWLTNQQRR